MAKSTTSKPDANDQRAPARTDTLEQQEAQAAGLDPAEAAATPPTSSDPPPADIGPAPPEAGATNDTRPKAARKGATRNAPPAAENLARHLITAMIEELRALPKPWPQLGETEQEDVIARLRKKCNLVVADAITVAAAGGNYRKAVLELQAVNSKAKTTECKLAIPSVCTEEIHNLLDVRGQRVVLLLGVDPATFGVGYDGVKGDANQLELIKARQK
jgi:hypothetical protein